MMNKQYGATMTLDATTLGYNRLIWDSCTPTRDRRPATIYDVENDINVEDYYSGEEILEELLDLAGYDLEDFDIEEDAPLEEKIKVVLGCFDDPGDGSPNILYCKADGKEYREAFPYDCLGGMDLATVTKKEVVDAVIGEFVDEDDF